MQRTVLIMAGGSGERFWPMSRRKKPKQLLHLTSPEKTMLEEAIDRIEPLISAQHIFIITSTTLQPVIREALPQLPPENVVAEPCKRNTAGCIALGAAFIAARYAGQGHSTADLSMAVLTADHLIGQEDTFRQTVDKALHYAETQNVLVTLGVTPTRPSTGYGYIESTLPQQLTDGTMPEIRPVKRFCEKPDLATAQEFVKAGNFFWNSGMFFWRLDTLIEGLEKNLPAIGAEIATLRQALDGSSDTTTESECHQQPAIKVTFEAFPDISIDYGLMEKATNVVVMPASFSWDDVGSWDAMSRTYTPDAQGNVNIGTNVLIDTQNSIVVNNTPEASVAVAVIGLEDVAVITTADGILVCPKDRVQEVKKAVKILRDSYGEKFV